MFNYSGNRSNSAGCIKAFPLRVPATATALALVMALSQAAHASVNPQSPRDLTSTSKRPQTSNTAAPQQTLTEVVVSGRREAIISADRIEKHANTIVDVVVANKAGLLPDNSVTEVLQRVSGVTMTRFSALNDPDHLSDQGTSVQIRGLSDVAARLNGQDIFSAGSGGGLSFSAIPPELLKAVEVYKDETSNLIEGGSGGQVDLITHMPFDYSPGLHVSGTVSGNWGDLSKTAEPAVSALATDNWRGPWGRFGALV
ncbi:MAG: TonB-dependent receptor plug domain-containing protein, partial [Gallionella sp.]|nr:TonB-dependent receptor plug domain-containing protein [Gallionella sp.]